MSASTCVESSPGACLLSVFLVCVAKSIGDLLQRISVFDVTAGLVVDEIGSCEDRSAICRGGVVPQWW